MATLFEQSISYNSRCFACGSLVYAVEKKLTTHHVYHDRCFRCRICKRNLTGFSLNEEGDDIYCANCYRRKQRGDCDSLEFHKAAAERAQYIHCRNHPELQKSLPNARTQSFREVTRHPSLSLRQLEKQVLSQHETSNENPRKSPIINRPLTINTSFSAPITLTKIRNDPLTPKDESVSLTSSIISNLPTVRTETIITPRILPKSVDIPLSISNESNKSIFSPTGSATGGIEFRLNKSNIDLTHVKSPSTERKGVIIPDLNPNGDDKQTRLRLTDTTHALIRRRSSSANYMKNILRTD